MVLDRVTELVSDELWQWVQPLLPQRPPRRFRHPGRLPRDECAAPAGIIHVLITDGTWAKYRPSSWAAAG
ncbi:hypothetical protein GCM10027586_10490 [Kineococcus gypseus]|uniref:hypothetical protein n=1 Tax=Kineococcus gypseus TaxID=1637102 RepID=UPI003D7CFCE9